MDVSGTDSRLAVCGLSNCDCAVQSRLSRALMTLHWEEVRICHVGLCATHLHCCSWTPGLTFKPVICLQPERKRPSSIAGAVVAPRHSSAVGYIEAGRRRNARYCLDSSGWKPHNWLMHPRSAHPSVCRRCCVSSRGFIQLFKLPSVDSAS